MAAPPTTPEVDLDRCLRVALESAQLAGRVIAAAWESPKRVEHKGSVDLVTETDKECERLIFGRLRETFPDHVLIGEETTASAGGALPELTRAPTWFVDPVDGTTNFVHSFPMSCVSIGLAVGREPVLGVVYNATTRELFHAVAGRGAFLNGLPIVASSCSELGRALFSTELGTRRDPDFFDAALGRVRAVASVTRSMRACGSCALSLSYVAAGRLDCYYEYGLGGPWDMAAGAVIAREAGALVLDPAGGPFNVMVGRVLAAAPQLAPKVSEILAACPEAPGEPLAKPPPARDDP